MYRKNYTILAEKNIIGPGETPVKYILYKTNKKKYKLNKNVIIYISISTFKSSVKVIYFVQKYFKYKMTNPDVLGRCFVQMKH